MSEEKLYNFATIAQNLYNNSMEVQRTIKSLYINKKLDLKEFEGAQLAAIKRNKEKYQNATTNQQQPTIAQFELAFKKLEDYPTGLEKLKKPAKPKKPMPRLNAAHFRGSSTSLNMEATFIEPKEVPTTTSKSPKSTTIEVKQVLNDFKAFQSRLSETQALQAKNKALAQILEKNLQQLHAYNRDVNFLCPDDQQASDAFTQKEEENLLKFSEQVQKLRFLLQNRNIFAGANEQMQLNDGKFQQYSNILNNSLAAVNNFKLE